MRSRQTCGKRSPDPKPRALSPRRRKEARVGGGAAQATGGNFSASEEGAGPGGASPPAALAGARPGSRGHSRGDRGTGQVAAGRPGRPPSAYPEPRTPAPPPSRSGSSARRGRCLGRRGRRRKVGARPGRPRAVPTQRPPPLLSSPARPPPSPGKRKRNSARRGLSGPRALSALPQQAGARGLHGATRLWRDRARRASGPSRCRLRGRLHPPPTARAARPPATPSRRPRPSPWAPPLLAGHALGPLRLVRAPPRRPGHPAFPAPHPCRSCVTRSCGQIFISVLLILFTHLPAVFLITMTSVGFLFFVFFPGGFKSTGQC